MDEDKLEEKGIVSQMEFDGNIMKVKKDEVELPDGSRSKREIVEHPGGVTILPITPAGNISLIEQYRYAAGEVLLELPAGRLEPGEDPEECGRRELKEETGYIAENLEHLFSFYTTPGYSTECLHLYLAENLQKGEQELDEGEFVRMTEIEPNEIKDLVFSGRIKDSKTAVGLLAFLQLQD